MIIKGVFRRYKRWNPVHPTFGAFWGMGLGIGCGVGWGPGFGPDVIGYVGAGCGVGFSVGITLLGFGIGLPANYIFKVPQNAIIATKSGALLLAQSNGVLSAKNIAWSGWNNIATYLSMLEGETGRRLSSLNQNVFLDKTANLVDMTNKLSFHPSSLSKVLETYSSRFFPSHKGNSKGMSAHANLFFKESSLMVEMLLYVSPPGILEKGRNGPDTTLVDAELKKIEE